MATYERAIALDPNDALIHCNLGLLLIAMGRKEEALAAFDAAIDRDDTLSQAHFGRGALLQEQHQWLGSLASYERAISINPGDLAAQFNRATVLRQLERWAETLACFERIIASNQGSAEAYVGRAESLQQMMRLEEAQESYDEAIAINPLDAATYNSRGVLLQKMGNFDLARASYDHSIALDQNSAQSYFNRGALQSEMRDFEGALADYRRAIALSPEFGEAHLNMGLIFLKIGDYLSGWEHYEWRWRVDRGPILMNERKFTQSRWLGEDITGQTILLHAEQGLGDSLQFCRFCEKVAERGAKVILEVPRALSAVCATVRGVAKVVSRGDQLPEFDVHSPLMSLPFALKTTLENIPARVPYLESDQRKVADWQERLGAKSKPRIGLTWSGSIVAREFSARSFPLAKLIPHLPADFEYFCAQTEIIEADQKTACEHPMMIRQFAVDLLDFAGTAALIECLDLVITMDTSIGHLSGALGKPTWVLLSYDGDWRWLLEREDSPWYPNVRLFRQKAYGDWDGVFARVAKQLRIEFGTPAFPAAAN